MASKKETELVPRRFTRDPFALMREMTTDFERMFGEIGWPSFRWPAFRHSAAEAWDPKIEVFEKDNRLFTKIDLPGMKKEDVKVEVTDGQLAISGERKREAEEKGERLYRCEREYGSFYRAVPMPEGAKLEDVKATFTDGVLEVSVALPARAEAQPRQVQIEEPPAKGKAA
jgi:HSP20 family protein